MLFTDNAAWSSFDRPGGMGFLVMSADKRFVLAGLQQIMDSEIKAVEWALWILRQKNINFRGIFMDCAEAKHAILHPDAHCNWRILEIINNINQMMECAGIQSMDLIPREWNTMADKIAADGKRSPHLSLLNSCLIIRTKSNLNFF